MDNFYAKLILKTMEPITNADDLIVSLDTVEFQKPELLRLDFSKTKRYIRNNDDGTCEIELYGYEFDYDTYKMDYEKLGLEAWDFDADYFDSILNDSLKVTEVLVDCTDRNNPENPVPLQLGRIQLVFSTDIGETVIDFTCKVTAGCREKLAYAGDADLLRIADLLTQYGDYDAFLESFSNAFFQSIETDEEKPVRLGRYALKAIKDNSIDDFLIAICGWSLETLMKKALIIPDVESQFHKEIEEATFVSIWDDDVRQEAPCKVNIRTREIFDIEHSSGENEEEVYECNGEFVMIDGIEFPAIPQDEFECGRKLAFWYGENE